ncbi:MAG: hypothetical protein NTX88_04795 [Candidatus Atribacteria bacterium]|nr:hypothetical protein [Candidatus Atribacteria bacterium]
MEGITWFKTIRKSITRWFSRDRDVKLFAFLFTLALWFFLLSELFAQNGYTWKTLP